MSPKLFSSDARFFHALPRPIAAFGDGKRKRREMRGRKQDKREGSGSEKARKGVEGRVREGGEGRERMISGLYGGSTPLDILDVSVKSSSFCRAQ